MPDFALVDGWLFRRLPDGSVHIEGPDARTTITPESWALIAASVSARGETGDTFRMARSFHDMQPRRMETL